MINNSLLVIILVLGTLLPNCDAKGETGSTLHEEWEAWKVTHGKSYLSSADEHVRREVWISNKKYIEDHNSNASHHGFTLGMNHFGDLVQSRQVTIIGVNIILLRFVYIAVSCGVCSDVHLPCDD